MSQSPELAGGEGFTFEGDAAAYYLTALLAEAYAPGIDDRTVVRVSVQQRDFGEPLDDVIVDFEDAAKRPARLSLQVKRSLTISSAKTNADFLDIITGSWATLKKRDFRINTDRYGVAVGTITPTKERALKTLCDWARESLATDHFDARFAATGSAGDDLKQLKDDIVTLLKEAKGAVCTSEEAHLFFAHFVLVQFDFLREGATDPSVAINLIRDCLEPTDAAKAPLVWSRVVQLARTSAGKSGQFDRARLVRSISPLSRLRGATSFFHDLNKLTDLAKSYVNLIPDDVGGVKLDRTSLLETLDAKLTKARVVQIRGLAGTGKSVLLRRAVQRALKHGPVIFLKAEQLEGTSWISYAVSHGLSGARLEHLLVEVGAAGTPILFVDAIDRVEKAHQSVLLELIRAIAESPLLENWRIVVSLRDTGIEVLRNWLGDLLDVLKVDTLAVGQLSDEEAATLGKAKPHLKPLLFGSAQVREIVRRPFFAKVLNQSYLADPSAPTFVPQSEVDLIENWWRRGGYNETGKPAIERQRGLLDLSRIRARQLSHAIGFSQLRSVADIDALKSDGILQNAREGISVRFAHDIFFEWAYFHVLADSGAGWIEEIRACGEPPAVARVVELVSQWEYAQGKNWSAYLAQTAGSNLRSQWMRAWLLGPVGSSRFEVDEVQFAVAVFANDFHLLRKALVWFQAEKTIPNWNILMGTMPHDQRQRIADLLGWPSDFAAWGRLISFLLRRISEIPLTLYPEIVEIFEVWQNALADLGNSTSHALLQHCAIWLAAIDAIKTGHGSDEKSAFWKAVPDLDAFGKSLGGLLMRSSKNEPQLVADYLLRVANSSRIRDDVFRYIIAFSHILAQTLPRSLVELSLAFLREELPDEQTAREESELRRTAEWHHAILAKPESARTPLERGALSIESSVPAMRDFSHLDCDRLSIRDDFRSFYPPSPLREPFHSLFQSSPNEALRLLREICNHAMAAWRQMHRHSCDRPGTPIPLELRFPWGTKQFWGTDLHYLWFRSTRAPNAIGCGLRALEEWCFAELGRGRPVDELIQQILEGNECVAILGISSMLLLQSATVSEVTAPFVTSQRLLAADHHRMAQDLVPIANLLGFTDPTDKAHIEAIRAANARAVRKTQLSWMLPKFVFTNGEIGDGTREAIRNFKNNLPYQFEEHRGIPKVTESLLSQAHQYAELADPENYRAYQNKEDSDKIVLVHHSPSDARPDNVARTEEATKQLTVANLWTWAAKSFEAKRVIAPYTVEDAIKIAREADADDLFVHLENEDHEKNLGMRRGAVASIAAITLTFRDVRTKEDLYWARDVLRRAIGLQEVPDLMWSPAANIPWHQAIYVARGLAADLREGVAAPDLIGELVGLIAHPLEVVSMAALEEVCNLWPYDSKLTWAGLILAFSLCRISRRPRGQFRQHCDPHHSSIESNAAVAAALAFYDNEIEWISLPLPPPARVKVRTGRSGFQSYQECDADVVADTAESWDEPDVLWNSKHAAKILNRIPFEKVLGCGASGVFLDFLDGALNWTIRMNAARGAKSGFSDHSIPSMLEWTRALGSTLGGVAGLIPSSHFHARFIEPILGQEDDLCWSLLSPFASTYVCVYVYDAPVIPVDAVATLDLCLCRLLKSDAFNRENYRSGEFFGSDQPQLVRTLMFVSIEHADLAARYVNGNWTELSRILPLIDRFVRAAGWAASVMDPFLTLGERARASYPAESFAEQVIAIIGDEPDNLKGWHGTFIPARIAELVQYFAHRDAPMTRALAQRFLRILDMLVDMGDRRSAALQLGEAFREIRLPS